MSADDNIDRIDSVSIQEENETGNGKQDVYATPKRKGFGGGFKKPAPGIPGQRDDNHDEDVVESGFGGGFNIPSPDIERQSEDVGESVDVSDHPPDGRFKKKPAPKVPKQKAGDRRLSLTPGHGDRRPSLTWMKPRAVKDALGFINRSKSDDLEDNRSDEQSDDEGDYGVIGDKAAQTGGKVRDTDEALKKWKQVLKDIAADKENDSILSRIQEFIKSQGEKRLKYLFNLN